MLIEFTSEAICSWAFFWGRFVITDANSMFIIHLFRHPITSWFSLGKLYVSRNLSIFSELSNLLSYNCSLTLMILYISVVSVLNVLPFVYDFIWVISPLFFLFFKLIYFVYLFLAALGLSCFVWAFSSCSKQELLFIAVRGLLIVLTSFVVEHRL